MIRLRKSEFKQNLKKEIKAAKIAYREKVELRFQSGNMREARKGIQTLTGETKTKACSDGLSQKEKITVNSSTHSTAVSMKSTTLLLKYPISKLNC